MAGDPTGGTGDIKFHLAGFPPGQTFLGGQSLADAIMHEFYVIMSKFKASLENNTLDLKKLNKLARAITSLSRLLNAVTESTQSPQQTVDQLNAGIKQVKQDIKAVFPKGGGALYEALMQSLNGIEAMFKGGVIKVLEDLAKDTKALMNWWEKEFHAHKAGKGPIGGSERDRLAKQLYKLLTAVKGDIDNLKQLEDHWDTSAMGPLPQALKDVYNQANTYWKATMDLHLHCTVIWRSHKLGSLWWNIKKLGNFLAYAFFAGRGNHTHWHKARNKVWYGWSLTGDDWMFKQGHKTESEVNRHKDLQISEVAIIKVLREMASGSAQGRMLEKYFPGIHEAYEQACRQVIQMEVTATSIGNNIVSNIYSKSTAMMQLAKTFSKDLQVPIEAVDHSIARVFQ